MRKFLCILIGLLLCNALLFGTQPTRSDSGTVFVASGPSVNNIDLTTLTVTAGSNLCLIATLGTVGAITSPVLQWNSAGTPQTMTLAATSQNTLELRVYYLVGPASGNLNLHAAWTTSRSVTLSAFAYKDSGNGSTCINAANTLQAITGSSTTPSTGAVTNATNGVTIGATYGVNNITATSTQTSIFRSGSGAASSGTAAGPNTHSWTMNTGNWAAAAVNIIEFTGATTCKPIGLPLLGVSIC